MNTDWRIEAPQIAVLLAMFLMAAVTWPTAPEQIPVHWDASGEVDRYGGKVEGLLLPPLLATGLYLLMRFAPRIDPGRANYPKFSLPYNIIRISTLLLFAGVYAVLHLWIRGRQVDVSSIMPLLIGTLFVVLGGVMGKLRPNWFMGIRTPWTLSSKTAWVRTHRIGGWLFILLGLLLIMALPFVDRSTAFRILVFGVAGIAVWSMVYSYLVWRNDPDKVPPAGTTPAD